MRLFVAIDLDERAREAMAGEQQRLKRALAEAERSLKWIAADQLHVTLIFLGHVDDSRAAAIIDTMKGEIAAAPFTMVFQGTGVFPPRGAPNVLWVGVTEGVRQAAAVHAAVGESLMPHGFTPEKRPYHPHLTLARWRTSRSADRRIVAAADRHEEIAQVRVSSVTLYQSQLSSAGPTYTALAHAPLRS